MSTALSVMFAGQLMFSSGAVQNIAYAVDNVSTISDGIIYSSELIIHGYVYKGMVDGYAARDNEPVFVRIFNGDWAEISSAEVSSDGSYSVTASGSDVYHVKFECNGYLPFYLKDFGTGSYKVGSGDSDDTVTLIPGDTTYNYYNSNQWSDDVLNADDLSYVQSCVGATSYGQTDFNLSMDTNNDGVITQDELDSFCAFYTNLAEGQYFDLSHESADIDFFDVNNDGVINKYDYYLMYDLVYNQRSPEVVNIPDLTGDGLFTDADLQPFWDRINEAANPDKWIWIYNHDMNRDGIVDINDYIIEKLNYYGNPVPQSAEYKSYMDKNGNGSIDNSDAAWFQAAYNQYGELDCDRAFKRTLTMNANGKFNWSLNLHDTNLNLNGCALYVGDSMSFTTDILSFWSDGEGAYLNINGGRLETGNNLVFRTASPDGWNGNAGQTMNLNGGSVIIGGDFNFGQANCYDTIIMNNDNDYLEINRNWNYITLTDMEGKWTAGLINFQGSTWQVNEASGPKSVYSSGTHSIRFYYADGKQTILWDNPNEFINAEDGSRNTLRTFNFDYVDPTTGECLGLIFPDGYSGERYWFRPWFEVETPAEWIPFEEWKNYPDTDGDGLPDEIEKYIGIDPLKKDTDDDGLTDFDELFKTFTDPTMYDTDSNGISDGQEDPDNDGLNNIREMEYGTDPFDEDTDKDGLTDGDEVNVYHSDPLKYDTDGDTLCDGDDVALGFDPTLPDTDFNGILDCDEKISQTLIINVDDDNNPIESVSVSFTGTGNINSNTSIIDIMNKDMMCSNVAGLIGSPYDINSTSDFDNAEISFKIRTDKLNGTSFDNLAILWYDEENHKFVIVDSILNSANNTVSATVPHFSKYMIIDKAAWYAVWEHDLYDAQYKLINAVLAIDCSGSMEDNDPIQVIPPSTPPYEVTYKSERSTAAKGFIDTLKESDKAAIAGFSNTATWLCGNLTSNKETLKASLDNLYQQGSTNFNPVLSEAINKLTSATDDSLKIIILMSDGGMLDDLDEPLNESLLTEAKKNGIKIYTIGLGAEADENILKHMAEATNGEYYRAATSSELSGLYEKLGVEKDFDLTDTDGDGLADVFEISGMRLADGKTIIYTDPLNPDSDGDGLLDGEEINPQYKYLQGAPSDIQYSTKSIYFEMTSDPTKKDTDRDNLLDGEDSEPLYAITKEEAEIKNFFENAELWEIEFYFRSGFQSNFPDSLDRIKLIEIFRKFLWTNDLDSYHKALQDEGYLGEPKNFWDGLTYYDFADITLSNFELASQGTSFEEMCAVSFEQWSQTAKMAASIWIFGVSSDYLRQMSQWDYTPEYKLSLEQERTIRGFQEYIKGEKYDPNLVDDNPAHNSANYEKLKESYRVQEKGADVIESLKNSGKLPKDYITQSEAKALGWNNGKALQNFAPGKKLGGDIFLDLEKKLPSATNRTWYEADVGINYALKRSNPNNPAYRILFSNDGLIYGTFDHYETMFYIGTY